MLQQGLFVADVAYYYGDTFRFFAIEKIDPAKILPGYDYDVITEEALLTRASVRDGKSFCPTNELSNFVLPDRDVISLPVLKKIKNSPPPAQRGRPKTRARRTLEIFPAGDYEIAKLADEIWNNKLELAESRR